MDVYTGRFGYGFVEWMGCVEGVQVFTEGSEESDGESEPGA